MSKKNKKILVQGSKITVVAVKEQDYISLTDMVRDIENGLVLIEKWLRNKNTIEYLGIWEEIYNPNFNSPEFEGIKNQAGLNRFALSVKQWVEKTQAIGIVAKAGRYGGTYAHKDIAFEFASWISPKFKIYLIKEFQRLKEEEQ
ncbi:MAG: KilA-N domain-containing protein, partial [Gallionella sp.]